MTPSLAYTVQAGARRRPRKPGLRPRLMVALLLLLAASLLFAAGTPKPDRLVLRAADLGERWPLTLTGGTLACDGSGAITLTGDDNASYALNDRAVAAGYPAPLKVWKYDDSIGGVNMPLAPLIEIGKPLCRGDAS